MQHQRSIRNRWTAPAGWSAALLGILLLSGGWAYAGTAFDAVAVVTVRGAETYTEPMEAVCGDVGEGVRPVLLVGERTRIHVTTTRSRGGGDDGAESLQGGTLSKRIKSLDGMRIGEAFYAPVRVSHSVRGPSGRLTGEYADPQDPARTVQVSVEWECTQVVDAPMAPEAGAPRSPRSSSGVEAPLLYSTE